MDRKEFLMKASALGLGIAAFPSLLTSCKKEDALEVKFTGKTIVIGAGAAGLMAGYTLQQHGADFEIIEASSVYGGRVKKAGSFASFPIDIGAEWIHTSPSIFGEMIDDSSVKGEVDLVPYQPQTLSTWSDSNLQQQNWAGTFYGEYKFKSTTWYDFFEQFIVPSISTKIRYNTPITQIDYTGAKIQLTDSSGTIHEADRVIITVPIKVLQDQLIGFSPSLPSSHTSAINSIDIPPGIKVFFSFSQRFYPDLLAMGSITGDGTETLYYDAGFKKGASDNILALFSVGQNSDKYTEFNTEQELIDFILNELDTIFDGQASQYYERHIVQNWSKEPFIRGSYSHYGSNASSIQETLSTPVDGRIYFSGEALHPTDWSTVHGAGLHGSSVAKTILQTA